MINSTGIIRIGTSNGYMPGTKFTFPPPYQLKSRLHFYSSIFNTIEVNRCFYKTPLHSTYEKWAKDVPENFQFTLKLSRDITHAKELQTNLNCMQNFLKAATGTGNKKGCLLIQFPGKITLDYFNQVELILSELRINDPTNEWRKAIEFRHSSWYVREMTELVDEFNAAVVLHDFSKAGLLTRMDHSNFVYMRFHGPYGNYRDSYSDHFLADKANMINEFQKTGLDVYAYFNNTIGSAFENARYLQLKSINFNILHPVD